MVSCVSIPSGTDTKNPATSWGKDTIFGSFHSQEIVLFQIDH